MTPLEIVVIVLIVVFVTFMLGRYIYRKKKHLPTSECACCKTSGKGLVEMYNKKYKKDCPDCDNNSKSNI